MVRYFVFSIVFVVMVFVALVVTSTSSFATDDPNVIHACIKKNNGQLRVVGEPSECLPSENPIDLQAVVEVEEDECPVNMVPVGNICVDMYEASVWSQPPDADGNPQGTQFGEVNFYPCSDNGNDCSDPNQPSKMIYAASVPGVRPSAFITWFQAQQACANVGKRLLTNAEWQMAAAGTDDSGTDHTTAACNIFPGPGLEPEPTGSRSDCVSNWGVFDMVGNVWEWVGDWIQDNSDNDRGDIPSSLDYGNDLIFGVDEAFPELERFPAALFRGSNMAFGTGAGVFALDARFGPTFSFGGLGFRCAK
ncbi:MAG TPA: SUMF1/EgtB/PvdO family nonheme iron enzyme [Thermodesulfobacteriota bacterium]|nr:SUMF1/EgtB/PvdO family nonheme iron enzyme [Thermodesulfobacteriota bacterium]